MPIRQVNGGYKWGESGKVYPNRAGAERQAQAAYASGYKGYQNGGIASIPRYQEGGLWNTGYGSNPIGGGGADDSGIWGSQLWNFLRPSIASYPNQYYRHFYRGPRGGGRVQKIRKKMNKYYRGDEEYRAANPLTPQDVADFKSLQERGYLRAEKPNGEEFLDEEWHGLTSDEMYEKLEAEAGPEGEGENGGIETVYEPNFPEYDPDRPWHDIWTDPITGKIWKWLGTNWHDTGDTGDTDTATKYPWGDEEPPADATEYTDPDSGLIYVLNTDGTWTEKAAETTDTLPEITVTANGNLVGLPLGVIGAVVATALGNLIWHPGEAGGSGFWENENTKDVYGPGGEKIPGDVIATGVAPETVDWTKVFEKAVTAGISVSAALELFGIGGGEQSWWQKLVEAYLDVQAGKGLLDTIKYKVPTGQGAAMSAYEKAHPLDIDVGLESLGPNYLEDQLYGIPIGAENVPAATHTLGFPYAEEIEEEVQGGQRGGIMNARSHGDIVPALLEPGEFVMTLQSVKGAGNGDARQGAKNMYKMMRQLEGMGQ